MLGVDELWWMNHHEARIIDSEPLMSWKDMADGLRLCFRASVFDCKALTSVLKQLLSEGQVYVHLQNCAVDIYIPLSPASNTSLFPEFHSLKTKRHLRNRMIKPWPQPTVTKFVFGTLSRNSSITIWYLSFGNGANNQEFKEAWKNIRFLSWSIANWEKFTQAFLTATLLGRTSSHLSALPPMYFAMDSRNNASRCTGTRANDFHHYTERTAHSWAYEDALRSQRPTIDDWTMVITSLSFSTLSQEYHNVLCRWDQTCSLRHFWPYIQLWINALKLSCRINKGSKSLSSLRIQGKFDWSLADSYVLLDLISNGTYLSGDKLFTSSDFPRIFWAKDFLRRKNTQAEKISMFSQVNLHKSQEIVGQVLMEMWVEKECSNVEFQSVLGYQFRLS